MSSELNSFILPQRLPKIVKQRSQCDKELKTDDSQGQHFTQQLESMRSVELNAKVSSFCFKK